MLWKLRTLAGPDCDPQTHLQPRLWFRCLNHPSVILRNDQMFPPSSGNLRVSTDITYLLQMWVRFNGQHGGQLQDDLLSRAGPRTVLASTRISIKFREVQSGSKLTQIHTKH